MNLENTEVWDKFVNGVPLNIAEEEEFRTYIENCGHDVPDLSDNDLQELYDEWMETNEL